MSRSCRLARRGRLECDLLFNVCPDKADQFRRALDRTRILEEISDDTDTAQSRNLPDIDRVVIEEDAADHCRSSIRYQHLRLRLLCGHGRNSADGAREVGLAVFDVDGQENRIGLGDLWRYRQVQAEAQE